MIEVSHISKRYGKKRVLTDVSFYAMPGEQISIVGQNGCGKTTLLKILAGIEKANSGTAVCYGKDMIRQSREFRKLCGYVPQENPLLEDLTVKDNLRLWGGRQSLRDQRLKQMFELEEILKIPVYKLSGGMKRRVAIACAVASWPSILLMDEPTTSVDVYYKNIIRGWMMEYRKMNGILILSTHDEQEIADSHRCLLLSNGRMEELGKEEKSLSCIYQKIKLRKE